MMLQNIEIPQMQPQNTQAQMVTICTQSEETQANGNNYCHYGVTMSLIILALYFLTFAIAQIITNHQSINYSFPFQCSSNSCTASTGFINFDPGNSVYIYLKNSILSQNDLSYPSLPNTIKNTYITNAQVGKTISLTGTTLNSSDQAYPNGQFQSYYPQGSFTITNTATNKPINLNTNTLSLWSSGIKNKNDLSTQWADVEASRYSNWIESQISLGLRKLWGYCPTQLSGNYTIQLSSTNLLVGKVKNGLVVELTNGRSLGGYNLALCVYHFIFALILVLAGGVSFWLGGREEEESKR